MSSLILGHIHNHRLTRTVPNSVVGLGYEEEFGSYRRTVQHAL